MAATITWSVDSHKHETAGKKCVLSVSYRVTGVDGDTTDSIYSEVSLDRPSDSDMQDYVVMNILFPPSLIEELVERGIIDPKDLLNTLDMFKQQEEFDNATHCYICNKEFVPNYKKASKVRDHDHQTGEYRGCAHNVCNINYNDLHYQNTGVLSQSQKLPCPFNTQQRTQV